MTECQQEHRIRLKRWKALHDRAASEAFHDGRKTDADEQRQRLLNLGQVPWAAHRTTLFGGCKADGPRRLAANSVARRWLYPAISRALSSAPRQDPSLF